MGYFVAFVLLLLGILTFAKSKCWYRPDVFMYMLWGSISFFAALRLYTLYAVSTKTWLIILTGTLCFGMGCQIGSKVNFHLLKKNKNCFSAFNTKYFWYIAIFTLLYGLADAVLSYVLMRNGVDLGDIRTSSFGITDNVDGVAPKSNIESFINTLLFGPLKTMTIALGIYFFLTKRHNNIIYIIVSFLVVIEDSIATGGRFEIAYFIIELLVAYSIVNRHYIPKRIKKYTKFFFVMGVGGIIIITLLRLDDTSLMLQKYYRYFCGDVVFFDLKVPMLDENGFWSLGLASLYGIFYPLFLILHHIVGIPYPNRYLTMSEIVLDTQTFAQIGDELYTNAFSTPFYYLYADFRIIGVILGMCFLGIFCIKMFRRCLCNDNIRYTLIYMIVVISLFNTIFCFPLVTSKFYLGILYICLLAKNIPIKRKANC